MRWADKSLRFIRPIRWLLALWGEEVLELELEGLRSSNLTWGHRFLAPGPWQVRHPEEYLKVLAEHFVMAEPRRRRETIEQALRELAQGLGASPVWDQELLEHVVHLVEYPVGVLCEFPIQYLELPEELLVTVMKDHQKYFALRGSDGRLLSHFVVISNTLRENALVVKAGAERVIKARFEDARFYWRQDLEQSLQRRLEGLKKVVYHERLGSLYDKALRLKSLAGFMAPRAAVETALAERAALLSKADLVSGVVREFPELQGVMGGYYALNDGEPPEVAQAIREHYLPRHAGDALPCSPLAVLLSLADKADNIASFFLLGLVPSGSEDPFALRRQALAIVHMLAEAELPLSLEELFEQALRGLQAQDNQALREAVLGFLRQRIPQVLQARGYESDVVEAVLPYALAEPLKSLLQRAEALRRLKKHAQFNPFLVAAKRVRNILPGEEPPPLREDLLREEGEQRLYQSLRQCAEKTEACLQDGDLEEAAEALLALTEPINHFFDAVLVMDKDPLVRANRLALLRDVWGLCLKVADFSKISEV
jgi:glycyl-tRNA synthetase beta chain